MWPRQLVRSSGALHACMSSEPVRIRPWVSFVAAATQMTWEPAKENSSPVRQVGSHHRRSAQRAKTLPSRRHRVAMFRPRFDSAARRLGHYGNHLVPSPVRSRHASLWSVRDVISRLKQLQPWFIVVTQCLPEPPCSTCQCIPSVVVRAIPSPLFCRYLHHKNHLYIKKHQPPTLPVPTSQIPVAAACT